MNEYIQENREESELAVFWEEVSSHLPKSIERSALGDEKIFVAFKIAYPKIREYIYNRGVEDSLKDLPERKTISTDEYPYDKGKVWGWNSCIEQTINNISKLLTNK